MTFITVYMFCTVCLNTN